VAPWSGNPIGLTRRGIGSYRAIGEQKAPMPIEWSTAYREGSLVSYWLMKSEPDVYGIDHLGAAPDATTAWWGVRNYQARNFMRDRMQLGDQAFFYHSSCAEPGIVGIVEVCSRAYPDETQFDPASNYHDPKATRENPRWHHVDVKLVRKTRLVLLAELRSHPELATMRILQRGNRLSITPVDPAEWRFILGLMEA
jgi:predicted RNA-binding protein with PUA-like domain